jgi:zinc transport system substrate-binding protein
MGRLRVCAGVVATAVLVAIGPAGCDRGEGGTPGRVEVVAAFYPLQFVAERVGANAVVVTGLAPPGTEPHDLELTPDQVRQIADAEVVAYLRGFQPAVDETVEQVAADSAAFDVAEATTLMAGDGGADPHVWLDPTRLAAIADRFADRLAGLVPDAVEGIRTRAAALRTDLEALDREYAQGLRSCRRKQIVTSHAAFGYLAQRYGLEQIAISGLSPETEPSPQRLADVTVQARRHGVTTIFFETLVSPRVAETLAREVGARAEVLDPIEGLEPGSADDYLSVMRANLSRLRTALDCP